MLKTVYLKRIKIGDKSFVYVYSDKEATSLKAIYNRDSHVLPNRRRKIITLNCWNFRCKWL